MRPSKLAAKALAIALAVSVAAPVSAETGGFLTRIFKRENDVGNNGNLRATIWVDPDGCEHWVMDDGLEGYMSQHLDKHGKPVCRGKPGGTLCRTLDSSTLFAFGSSEVMPDARQELETFFGSISGSSIFVDGHTDSVGSESANLSLSLDRAMAVAKIANGLGVNAESRGFGESAPVASNDTEAGRAANRRVELSCL